jgi:hypothetical protein
MCKSQGGGKIRDCTWVDVGGGGGFKNVAPMACATGATARGAASQKHQCYGLRDIVYGRLEDLLSPDSTPSATIYHPPLFAQRCKIRETRGILIGQ